ncbi:hypothetical protein LR48_Vigan11g124100 [Vigna angularis]|uniref:Uncharacterized protein n=1 Tax=Phaseolus angularis TaxID=3914 RepID=A0A0L9VTM3_PHAAN|nr:hypothetical protein LR48_Vigan11g124100 [Vigna angularis]
MPFPSSRVSLRCYLHNYDASFFAASNHFRRCLNLIALRVVHLAASNDAGALSIAAPTTASNDLGAFIFVAVRVVYLAASNDVSAFLLPLPPPPSAAAPFLSFPGGENPSGPNPFFPSLFRLLFSPSTSPPCTNLSLSLFLCHRRRRPLVYEEPEKHVATFGQWPDPSYGYDFYGFPGGDYPYYPPPGPSSSPPRPHPVPSSPPRVFTWDFLNVFGSFENRYLIYPSRFESRASSLDSKEVREREGIPELEDEMENEVSIEALVKEKEGKKVVGEKGSTGVRDFGERPSNTKTVPLQQVSSSEGSSKTMVAPLRLPSDPPFIQFSSRKIKLARAYRGEPWKDFKTNPSFASHGGLRQGGSHEAPRTST